MKVQGAVFADRWEVLEFFASGSTSEVFRGRDRKTGDAAAIKVLRPEYATNNEALQRFQREARVALMLTHPYIVEVRDFGVDDGHPWIAMELLEGETLETRLQRDRIPSAGVLDVIDQVASAVDHAHSAGIVHRDLKPDNVFLLAGDGFRVKVLDFGFAKLLNTLEGDGLRTASNALLGTPLYMAPEQIRSSATVDLRADLWSLGVIAYELMTGGAPFESPSTADLLVEILSKPVTPPSKRDAALPVALDRWVVRALKRDPDERFATASELAKSLRASMDPATARAAASATAPHTAVRVQGGRSPSRFIALAIGLLVVLAGLWILSMRHLRS